ncbi:MAG: 4'-phosphopantetheinyl transferase superfamily protein [Oscillospiraceae bacterium]|nr:4'-phosphopantetheinyl transferase superfamily protein [Oscillospiraceae bacterium]
MLSRLAIAAWCNVPPESIEFNINKNGKPFAKDLDVEFNISHSHDMVVCAVSDKPVGIDIEKIRPIKLNVAKRICTKDELIYLFGHTPNEQDFEMNSDIPTLTRFFEIWTAKEAYGKCVGIGLGDIKHDTGKSISDIHRFDSYVICIFPSEKIST